MIHNIELALRDALLSYPNAQEVAKRWIAKLKLENFKPDELRALVYFFLASGMYVEIFRIAEFALKNNRDFPWALILSTLQKLGIEPEEKFFNLLDSATGNKDIIFRAWEAKHSRLAETRKRIESELKNRRLSQEEEFEIKLNFLQNDRLLEEEKKHLRLARELFPNNSAFKQAEQSLNERLARQVIQAHNMSLSEIDFIESDELYSPSEIAWIHVFANEARHKTKSQPQHGYDLALSLYFINLYNDALSVVRLAPQTLATDWFKLECLLKAKRYIEGLDILAQVEGKYAENPETVFASTYLRSLILYGLGHAHKAKELMQSIVMIRPNYRSAHALLMSWGDIQ